MVSLGKDGHIASQGTVSDALKWDAELKLELSQSKEANKKEAEVVDVSEPDAAAKEKQAKGKLVMEEETAEGHISWQSSTLFPFLTLMELRGGC